MEKKKLPAATFGSLPALAMAVCAGIAGVAVGFGISNHSRGEVIAQDRRPAQAAPASSNEDAKTEVRKNVPASRGGSPVIAGCPVFPPSNVWNARVDQLPVDRVSKTYIESIGADKVLHPDFSATGGIPYNVVSEKTPGVTIKFSSTESDLDPYPVPPNPLIEEGTDRHFLILQTGVCRLYEVFAYRVENGVAVAGSGAIYDLRTHSMRPEGWTSADAAGLPILPALVRYEEVAAGEIRHCLRVTAPQTRRSYVWPAKHFASRSNDWKLPPMGQRFRLKADFDISGFSKEGKVILTALKRYGAMLSDNGSAWFITGVPDKRWPANELTAEFRRVKGSDFEAVDVTSIEIGPHTGRTLPPE